jgi:CRP-like cAMP-binding protein
VSSQASVSAEHERLLRKLDTIARLGPEDRAAIARLPLRIKTIAENADLVQEGDRPHDCCLILDGFVARYKLLGQGQRQIFSFHIPGDIPDVHSLHMEVMDHSLGALTPCRVAYIPHPAIHELIFHHPSVGIAFWRDTLIDAAVFREWLAGVGRRTAHQRIAHLFCELYVRLQSVGLVEAWSFQLPITQAELADGLGLSPVHVNRVLQDLRRDGLIVSRGSVTEIADWDRLQIAGDFDPGYLHLRPSVV